MDLESLEAAGLIAQGLLGLLASGDVDVPHQVMQDLGDGVTGGNSGERSPLTVEQGEGLCPGRCHNGWLACKCALRSHPTWRRTVNTLVYCSVPARWPRPF